MPLDELRARLGQCVDGFKAAGLIEIVDNQFVIAEAPGADTAPIAEEAAPEPQRPAPGQGWDGDPTQHQHQTVAVDDGDVVAAEDLGDTPEITEDVDVLDLDDALELVPDGPQEDLRDEDQASGEPSPGLPDETADGADEAGGAQEPVAETIGQHLPEGADEADVFDLTDALELVPDEDETPAEHGADGDEAAKEDPEGARGI